MAKQQNVLEVKGVDLKKVLRMNQQVVLVPGAETYTNTRTGEVVLDNGTNKLPGEVKAKFIGSLFSLVQQYGRESIYAAGQVFDPSAIFDILDDNGMPIDPRAVYTAVMIVIPASAELA